MNGLLAVAMATDAGLALFHDSTFNLQFKTVPNAWNTFLRAVARSTSSTSTEPEKRELGYRSRNETGEWHHMEHDTAYPAYGMTRGLISHPAGLARRETVPWRSEHPCQHRL